METRKIKKCFLRESDGSYTEISYDDLLRLEEHDSSFRSRFFLALENGLLEVPEDTFVTSTVLSDENATRLICCPPIPQTRWCCPRKSASPVVFTMSTKSYDCWKLRRTK